VRLFDRGIFDVEQSFDALLDDVRELGGGRLVDVAANVSPDREPQWAREWARELVDGDQPPSRLRSRGRGGRRVRPSRSGVDLALPSARELIGGPTRFI
jgi:hypothetical protein